MVGGTASLIVGLNVSQDAVDAESEKGLVGRTMSDFDKGEGRVSKGDVPFVCERDDGPARSLVVALAPMYDAEGRVSMPL